MDRINKNTLFKIILGISVFIVIGLIFYIIITVKDIKKISNDIYLKRIELEQKYQAGLSLRENIQELVSFQPTINSINQSFVNHLDTLVFINDLEQEADKLGLKQIINIPEVELEQNKITSSGIQLTLNGQIKNIFQYINIIDTKPYYINISDIKISKNQNNNNPSNQDTTANINGTIYWK